MATPATFQCLHLPFVIFQKEYSMNTKVLGLAFALLFSTVVVADDAPAKKKKRDGAGRKSAAANVLKQLKDVGLTDEQKTKIQALAKKSRAEMLAAREEAGITPELMKKRYAAMKELRESGKKPGEIFAAVNKQLDLNEAQVKALKQANTARTNLLKSAVALLTDEQKAKLPERLLKSTGKRGKGKGKGKGKKKKAE